MQRIIAHIDMNSYFASVEQQANPNLRGKPLGVTGSSKKRTLIVAASVEAKKFGVKTGTQLYDAKQLCPQIVLVPADCKRYEAVASQFLKIFISKTPIVEIFSIDEAFLDLSGQTKSFDQARQITLEIKSEIKKTIGAFVRCSVGIAPNKFLAKLASEAKKPDGLTIVKPGYETKFLDKFELEDVCGIGPRISLHLNKVGVYSFSDLRRLSQTELTLNFNSYGLRLYRMARGIDYDKVHPYFIKKNPKSISRSSTIDRDIYSKKTMAKMILAFCENISAELRGKTLTAGSVGIMLRFNNFTHAFEHRLIKTDSCETKVLYQNCLKLLEKIKINRPVRKLGVVAASLRQDMKQIILFENFSKNSKLEKVCDHINQNWGKNIIHRASLVGFNFSGETPNYGFKKDILA